MPGSPILLILKIL